ncbi:hypothetical protein J3A69_002422 [Pseudomonas putida]|jgi:hypothetical protein|nr:hypothetical protein L483_17510 [Pseudomonas putida H8234]MBP2083275.1 hypothetical protein [Pseudomonas sp. PvP089]MBP2091022.1 hypothetical protein [Pseudomonas sp. PvP088]MBP2222815.1 hypothetical protein [Pseudomonas putida]
MVAAKRNRHKVALLQRAYGDKALETESLKAVGINFQ